MSNKQYSLPFPTPRGTVHVSPDMIMSGQPIPPIERIKLFSALEWEEFALECVHSMQADKYSRVERCGGSGDMGRDVIAFDMIDCNIWDNYQCKHYGNPLRPSEIWIELGKLVYYTFQAKYTYPRHYFFVAPQGAGTRLSNLFKKPRQLRDELLANWNSHCREKITSTTAVELDSRLMNYIQGLDFSIFEAIPPLRLIDEYAKTRWYVARFGGGLPARPPVPDLPTELSDIEANYVRRLLDAYGDHIGHNIDTVDDILSIEDIRDHFRDSRLEFYSAESLRAFSRDTLPPGEFEKLQDEIHTGIRDEVRAEHPDGYRRVVAVVRTARFLQITDHALVSALSQRDRGGICHQLANNGKVRWVR